ncbi:helix-turn-helix domain-containing protein [Alicyclobacillus sp. ALC3]|uniref:helix-turn-helix domain-containing protein n=1 Tax=Alicyclobacillus sp. ALC3 TaxID=2796143 RepID=UPI002379D0FE|nr:helix-turn-helix transcriptional regulator [Alicyclobacillus sp. ALC3]WDL98971.1 helix-turn-helix transcriptional regulator [Alicyclobacillus sp. ALC3]
MLDAFGRRIRAYRKLKRLTQVELAEQLGVSIAIVGTLERGTRVPSRQMITHVATVLQVPEAELLGGLTVEELVEASPGGF